MSQPIRRYPESRGPEIVRHALFAIRRARVDVAQRSTAATRLLRDQGGQTFTEYTMILGILTAIIVALTGMIVPQMRFVIQRLVTYMAIYLTSAM